MTAEESKETMDEPHEITNEVVVNNGDVAHDDERDEDASDAQAQVIASLRSQVTDLFSQVTQLNSKLVSSYDRVSDLEDQIHDSSASLRNATVTISSLELERTHHLAALNTGLLVEKAHVTAELNRLMERATEEAAQRGQAESARQDIEKDLDDLSATLFQQANTMVAEARLNQARSERKVLEAEEALKGAEDAVKLMQTQMQTLEADKESAEREAQEARISMGKGKWVERDDLRVGEVPKMRFMITHAPYAEFIAFVTHLRGLRSSQPTLPVISSLLGQPFLARLLTEDSEPTVRLDLAPSLNWLSRRSVLAAIHTGMLIVEPMSFSHLLQELHLHSQSQSSTSVSCALCGTPIVRLLPPTAPEKPPSHPLAALARSNGTNGNSWFKYPLALSSTTQVHDSSVPRSAEYEPPEQVYIFRLAAATSSQPPPALAPVHTSSASTSGVGPVLSRPPTHHTTQSRVLPAQTQNSPHPLCISNYCLLRLRSTCSLWAFVRTGIIERVWEEEVVQAPKSSARVDNLSANGQGPELPNRPTTPASAGSQPPSATTSPSAPDKPPVPPRRRRLWEMASALGERAVSWGKEGGESAKEKGGESGKKLPPPPPAHPSAPHPHPNAPAPQTEPQVPPPLPKRNEGRGHSTPDTAVPEPSTEPPQKGTAAVIAEEPSTVTDNNSGFSDAEKVDKNGSNDSFSTPTDEIVFSLPDSGPPTAHRASIEVAVTQDQLPPPSPRTVPLPQTPTSPIPRIASPVSRPRSRVASPASPPPASRAVSPTASRSRAGSPAPGLARTTSPVPGRMSTSSPFPPSRTGSPAPAHGAPPVPRRAAARRAVPPPPGTAGPAASETAKDVEPAPVAAAAPPAEETAKAQEDSPSKDQSAPVPDTSMDAVVSTNENIMSTSTGGGVDDTQVSASSDAQPAVITPEAAAPAPADPEPIAPAQSHISVDVPSTEKSRSSTDSSIEKSIDTASTKRSSNIDGEGFASDATWEERTWKEVVRLKEEMFWARIGGVQAL